MDTTVDMPTVAALFRLDDIPGLRRMQDPATTYCFRPPGLLPQEHLLTIDVSSGDLCVLHVPAGDVEHRSATTRLEPPEMRSFIALALSFPGLVTSYQMLMLCDLRDLVAVKAELEGARAEQRVERLMQPVTDLVRACNHKLLPLGLVIRPGKEKEWEGYQFGGAHV
jgi:hypothetical protein